MFDTPIIANIVGGQGGDHDDTVDNLLLETGDNFLLEDGGLILIE